MATARGGRCKDEQEGYDCSAWIESMMEKGRDDGDGIFEMRAMCDCMLTLCLALRVRPSRAFKSTVTSSTPTGMRLLTSE